MSQVGKDLKEEYEKTLKKLEAAENRLEQLRRHQVYVFFDIKGKMLYAGQDVEGGLSRIQQHLLLALGKSQQSVKPFHTKLREHLKVGVYAKVIFAKLDELGANEYEYLLIEEILKDRDFAGDSVRGRVTDLIQSLSPNQIEDEIAFLVSNVSEVFKQLTDADLFTLANAEDKMKKELQ